MSTATVGKQSLPLYSAGMVSVSKGEGVNVDRNLSELSAWRFIEVWTIEEAAMIWAAIDPAEFENIRLEALRATIPLWQYKKAWVFQRAIVEAVCSGTLSFDSSIEVHDSGNYNDPYYERSVDFPDLPDPHRMVPHLTRIKQASFLRWAASKGIMSHKQESQLSSKLKLIEAEIIEKKTTSTPITQKNLPSPSLLTIDHPMAASELIAANEIWEIVVNDEKLHTNGKPIKQNLLDAINNHPEHKALSNEAKGRICTVTNWKKKGGATKTP
jgi:hypothetical protein